MRKRPRITRDILVIFVALGLGIYEVVYGGARPSVLTFCIALLASPVINRIDETRRMVKNRILNDTDSD